MKYGDEQVTMLHRKYISCNDTKDLMNLTYTWTYPS